MQVTIDRIDAGAAHTIAAAIKPQVKAYIAQNRAKYEAWLQTERDKSSRSDDFNSKSFDGTVIR